MIRISGITYVPRKTHTVRNITITVILILLLLIVTVLLISTYTGWRLVHPARLPLPAFSSNIVPDYKEASFKDINKTVNLKGWLFEAKGSTKTIILAHGYGQNRLQFGEKTLDMVKNLLAKGYNVLLFDFRNSGMSEGNLTSISIYEKDDLLGAVNYVKAQGAKNVVLLGYSMGAATSILAAAESPDVDGVIADSPFSDLNEYLNESLPVWSNLPSIPFTKTILLSVKLLSRLDPSDSSPREAIAKIAPRPVLLIHSKDDKSIPSSSSRELYSIYSKAAGDKAEFWETKDADHVGTYEMNPDEYMKRIFSFLDKVYPAK